MNNREKKIWTDPADMENAICSISRLSEALRTEPYSYSVDGITGNGSMEERGQAALDFIEKYYELTAGTLELIAAASGLVATALANANAKIVLMD